MDMTLSEQQVEEMRRMKSYFPYRIIFGVIDKDSGDFFVYSKTTKRTMNRLVREGHAVFTLD